MGKALRMFGIDFIKQRNEQHGQNRGFNTATLYQSNPSTGRPTIKTSEFIRTSGGVLSGPLGSIATTITLDSSGKLNIASEFGASLNPIQIRRRIFVDPETGTTDTLDLIDGDGKEIYGQELILMGDSSSNTITITHNSGSASGNNRAILCPGAVDFTLSGTDAVILVYDEANTVWVVMGSATGTQIADGDTKVVVTDATPDIQFQVNGVTAAAFGLSGGGDERLFMNTGTHLDMNANAIINVDVLNPDSGVVRFPDETVVKALTGFVSFAVGSTSPDITDASNVGALQIPYKEDTDDSPSSATLNNWFGDQNGCIGLQYDNDTPDVFTLWAKLNSTWHKVTLT